MSRPLSPPNRARELSCLLASIAMAGFWFVMGAGIAGHAARTDFLSLYAGAGLALEGKLGGLHAAELQVPREQSIVPTRARLIYVRPHLYAAALAPLALLPLDRSFAVWIAAQCLLAAGICWWAWKRFGADALLWCVLFPPLALGIVHGQDNALMVAILVAGWAALEKGNDRTAGIIWSLLLTKFHLLAGLVLALLWLRKRRALQGLAIGGIVYAVVTAMLAGTRGIALYFKMLTAGSMPELYPAPEKLANLHGIAASFGIPESLVYAVLGPLIVALVGFLWKDGSPAVVLASSMAGALLLTPHIYLYDLSLLLLPLLLIHAAAESTLLVRATGVLLSPLVTIWTLSNPPWCSITPLAVLLWLGVAVAASRMRQRRSEPATAY